ncbi:nitrate- and nitrite sensing domain-containing protein [Pseudonocardia sp. DSM 110487]|uniref:sensor histidine kinase n=1 Tax=Pseudonocardia sp. DSM 110487 TaxID=2865833 RepID=UPI001C698437|nr:nitrate- and nitrite sensing domain-containing protein [Pseudonocardia sp. DSM 110487]QYN31691.1 nitrate- and nitrite sensing domain-containing protein [Pseudonocardia sp. DSM 110487]
MTTDDRPAARRRSAWPSPRHWSVRVKFSVVVVVPLVLAVALGTIRILDEVAEAAERGLVARFVSAQGMVTSLVVDVERERYRATEFVANGRADPRALQGVVDAVDQRAARSRDAVARLADDVPAIVLVQQQADQAISRLPPLREVVTRSNAPPEAVVARYSELIEQLVQLDTALLRNINTSEVTGLANALAGLGAARNEATLQQAQMAIAVRSGLSPTLGTDLQFSNARLESALADFRVSLNAPQRVRYAGLIPGPGNSARNGLVQAVLTGSPPEGDGVATVADVYSRFLGEVDAAAEGLRSELRTAVVERRQSALVEAWANAVVLLLALVLAGVIVGFVARSMIASLRTLRRSAITVAQDRLPEAVQRMRQGTAPNVNIATVPVTTREEVGEVARAFDAVHEQAVRLAAEQATLQNNINAMYVNLSRRSQALVDRQLVLIEQLEEGEVDPEQLSDLFRLDHLATRMRRNCENLLVLAGADIPRPAAESTPVLDVLRAAVSEIEHYQRVVVQNPPDATFAATAANDIQHLLAELLDNATNFSPSDSQVVMSCSQARDDSILVEIFDEGIGLSPGELGTLNERLRNPVESTASVAASRRMGLFVVGRLANRHGISVGLFTDSLGASAAAAKRGVTARVTIPAELVGERVDEPDQVVWSRIDPAPAVPSRIVLPPGPAPRTPAGGEPLGAGAAGSDGAALPSDDHSRPAPRPRYDPTSGETTMRLPVVSAEPEPHGEPEPAPPPVDAGAEARLEPPNLFEPIVPPPSLPDPGEPRPPDPLASEVEEFEATPIFAEVTSGWFHVPAPRSHDAEPVPAGVGARARQDPSAFVTSADAVWQAARAATESQTAGYTTAGLPKRVPRGRLMPGSAMPGEPPPSISGRDPDAVRGRLSTFQRGVRNGRHMRAEEEGS